MLFNKRIVTIMGFLLLANPPVISTAQEKSQIYTMEKSVKEAFENNWQLKAKKEKIEQAALSNCDESISVEHDPQLEGELSQLLGSNHPLKDEADPV